MHETETTRVATMCGVLSYKEGLEHCTRATHNCSLNLNLNTVNLDRLQLNGNADLTTRAITIA